MWFTSTLLPKRPPLSLSWVVVVLVLSLAVGMAGALSRTTRQGGKLQHVHARARSAPPPRPFPPLKRPRTSIRETQDLEGDEKGHYAHFTHLIQPYSGGDEYERALVFEGIRHAVHHAASRGIGVQLVAAVLPGDEHVIDSLHQHMWPLSFHLDVCVMPNHTAREEFKDRVNIRRFTFVEDIFQCGRRYAKGCIVAYSNMDIIPMESFYTSAYSKYLAHFDVTQDHDAIVFSYTRKPVNENELADRFPNTWRKGDSTAHATRVYCELTEQMMFHSHDGHDMILFPSEALYRVHAGNLFLGIRPAGSGVLKIASAAFDAFFDEDHREPDSRNKFGSATHVEHDMRLTVHVGNASHINPEHDSRASAVWLEVSINKAEFGRVWSSHHSSFRPPATTDFDLYRQEQLECLRPLNPLVLSDASLGCEEKRGAGGDGGGDGGGVDPARLVEAVQQFKTRWIDLKGDVQKRRGKG
eukprot:TRINITY_DN8602_c0_g1_i1.p1 TRINITY_DN8602_c0_g1~~TRINITY_DN8602_c0_g1_i1.p1  ORF type:complete len:469 (-),score=53.09 TRINITY_DN8602_c0_g1_i1:14-1420(-)